MKPNKTKTKYLINCQKRKGIHIATGNKSLVWIDMALRLWNKNCIELNKNHGYRQLISMGKKMKTLMSISARASENNEQVD